VTSDEEILAFAAFEWDRWRQPLSFLTRPWHLAFQITFHAVVTTRRLILVRVSNPYDSSLLGGPLINAAFGFNSRNREWIAAVRAGRLEEGLRTTLRQETFHLSSLRAVRYDDRKDGGRLTIEPRTGARRDFPLASSFGARPITSLGGGFRHSGNFAAAIDEANRLIALAR
jgi:hypothetical protein